MNLVRTIPTPWAPYSVTFSRDGTRLAIGGGSWYGMGGIVLVHLMSGEQRIFASDNLPPAPVGWQFAAPTVSGVCFSDDDRYLAASTWSASHSYGPTCLLAVDGLELEHRESFLRRESVCPTGVLIAQNHIVTRNHRAGELNEVVNIWRMPKGTRVDGEVVLQHLTSSRVIVVRDTIVTAGRDLQVTYTLSSGEQTRPPDGLLFLPLRTGVAQVPQTIPVKNGRRVTAIGATRTGDGFITGGRRGKLSRWSWSGGWQEEPIRGSTKRPVPRWPDLQLTWATYNPNSIVGICSLCDGDGWLSVAADGELCLWEGDRLVESWMLPESGSPRSIAAHPDRPWVAVGIKKGGFGRPESAVAIVEVSPFQPYRVAGPWSSTVLRLAEALAAGEDCRLPLSDALEESGHPQLATHFRDRRSHPAGCWAVEHILKT